MIAKNAKNSFPEAQRLNTQFKEIRNEFIKFLSSLNVEKTAPITTYQQYFDRPLIYPRSYEAFKPFSADSKLILNFNYTQLPEKVYGFKDGIFDWGVNKVINIHGDLEDNQNPVIFGYGDEMDEHHHTLESLEIDYLLEHFKSTQYSKSHNYHELLNFIELGPYQVDIIGHGCGMTDRVLLNHLFEHDNCDRIKIFHYKDMQHYTETYMHISRHFSRDKKQLLRERVLPFDLSTPCPQSEKSTKVTTFGPHWLSN